jgi:LacI family transcriptional regulator
MSSVTITDVARRAGVSMKTVSRVLNGEPHVREEVRDKVLKAAQDLRYRPKLSARSLAGARSYQIGFVLGYPSPYFMHAQLGALKACHERGFHLVVEPIETTSPDLAQEMETLTNGLAVDGMILLPIACDNQVVLDALDGASIPYVRVAPATSRGHGATIEVDDEGAARTITDHLLDLGHRRIGLIQGPVGHAASVRRLEGFRKALAARGIEPDPALLQEGRFLYLSGLKAAERLLALPEPPTAIFASNDEMALGVMAAAQSKGLRIPEDLSVVGFDDIATSGMVWPGLPTMRQPMADMGAAAAEVLIATAGKAPSDSPLAPRRFACELMVRGSTAPPRG